MYVLYRGMIGGPLEPVGFFDSFPEAQCAYEEERKKEDHDHFVIQREPDERKGEGKHVQKADLGADA